MKIQNTLKKEIEASIEALIKAVSQNLKKKMTTVDTVPGLVALFSVLRGMKMSEEVRLLGILITSRAGEQGVEITKGLMDQFLGVTSSAPAPTQQIRAVTMVAPAPATKPAVTDSTTAPARKLEADPYQLKTWRGFLYGVLNNKNIPWKNLQTVTVDIFKSAVRLTESDWKNLFSAMKIANSKSQYVISNACNPVDVFKSAPSDLLRDLLFGEKDGLVATSIAEVGNHKTNLPIWMASKVAVIIDGVEVLDSVGEGLSGEENDLAETLLKAVEKKDPPAWLLQKVHGALGGASPTSISAVHKAAKVTNNPLAAGLANFKVAKHHIPEEKYSKPEVDAGPVNGASAPDVTPIPASEPAPASTSEAEPEPIPATETASTPEPVADNGNGDDKPAELDASYEAEFVALMESEVTPNSIAEPAVA